MSKILFITQKLTPNSLNQIEIIRRSGHEFTVVTSQGEKNAGLNHSDVLYYFSRWNLLEMTKFLPSFMVINPDIVHVFVDSSSSMKAADFFSVLSGIFKKLFSVQFFLSEDSFLKMKLARRLVYAADIVTGPHRTFLFHLRGLKARNRYQIKGVIPPILRLAGTESSSVKDGDFNHYQLLVPLKKGKYDINMLSQLAQRFSILFVADLRSWTAGEIKKLNYALSKKNPKPWRFFPLNAGEDLQAIPQTDFTLWLAGLDFELDECIRYFEFSLNRKIKIVLDHTQVCLYPDLWDNNPMAVVAQKHGIDNFIANFEWKQGRIAWSESLSSTSLVDISVNEFNRLISKATHSHDEKAI